MVSRHSEFLIKAESDEYRSLSLAVSFGAHFILALILFLNFGWGWGDFEPPVIYSVTIEGGKKLGGISQVPEKDAKAPVAPPKKTSSEEKEEAVKKPEVIQKTEESKLVKADDGEVHVNEKIKAKEKPEVKKPVQKETIKKKEPIEDPNKKYQEALQRYLGESSNAGSSNQFGAAALGGNSMGGGVVRPPEFFAYLKKLEQYIKAGWVWTDTSDGLVTQVVFDMSPDGRISAVRVTKGSGNPSYDDSVYRAVLKASPAPPPPPIVYEFFKSVRMTFDPRE